MNSTRSYVDPKLYRYNVYTFDSNDFYQGSRDYPVFLFQTPLQNLDTLNLHSAIIPTTYYVFSGDFYTSCAINGQNVTWPAGNYTPASWIATISPSLTNTSVTYSDITNRLTITNTAGNASITFNQNQRSNELLGFNTGNTTSGTSTLTAPFVANFSGPNFVYLRSNIASVFNQDEIAFTASQSINNNTFSYTNPQNILAMIPITVNTGSVTFHFDQSQRYLFFANTTMRKPEFYFTLGNRQTVLGFNGQSFQLILHGFAKSAENFTYNSMDNPPM